jgi:hypothetical protein
MFLSKDPLPVFSRPQFEALTELWIDKVSRIGMNKLEEEHWTDVYCSALNIPQSGFSNIFGKDTEYGNSVIEMKCIRKDDPFTPCRIMHPALTRRVAEWSSEDPPHESLKRVIDSYNTLIKETFSGKDARWGLLVYSPCLSKACYFEYPIQTLDISKLEAEYSSRKGSSSRNSTVNLWVFQDQVKIMSVTSPKAGMKIQPYFQVPHPHDNRYEIDLSNQKIPIDRSIELIVRSTASELGMTEEELIELSLMREYTQRDSGSSLSVNYSVVKSLGGMGSNWQQELARRVLLASEALTSSDIDR